MRLLNLCWTMVSGSMVPQFTSRFWNVFAASREPLLACPQGSAHNPTARLSVWTRRWRQPGPVSPPATPPPDSDNYYRLNMSTTLYPALLAAAPKPSLSWARTVQQSSTPSVQAFIRRCCRRPSPQSFVSLTTTRRAPVNTAFLLVAISLDRTSDYVQD